MKMKMKMKMNETSGTKRLSTFLLC